MKPGFAALVAAALLPGLAIAQTPTSTADIDPRTELHAIPTMTVSDSNFLAGKDGKAVTVAGQLRVAQGTGKLPVVIVMHGSGGMGAQLDTWSRLFNAIGLSSIPRSRGEMRPSVFSLAG
jgi:poly(3-hydroxybutyrate) depolymerase